MHDPIALEILHVAATLVAGDLKAHGLTHRDLSDDELGALLADAIDLDMILEVDVGELSPAARQIADRALAGDGGMAVAA